jgi:flavin prenyltransferase
VPDHPQQQQRQQPEPRRLIVGISGASGVVYGVRLLEALRALGVEAHLIMTRAAEQTLAYETDLKVAAVAALAAVRHPLDDVGAAPSSGSFRALGMVVAPCSMRTLAEIATGLGSNLLTRAADVTLKERRRLVLLARETPLHALHLRHMLTVTELGGIIAPPVPAFYNRPASLEEMVDHTVGRVLDLFGLDTGRVRRWGEPPPEAAGSEGRRPVRAFRRRSS